MRSSQNTWRLITEEARRMLAKVFVLPLSKGFQIGPTQDEQARAWREFKEELGREAERREREKRAISRE